MRIIILICVFISLIVIAAGGWYLFRLYKSGGTKTERTVETQRLAKKSDSEATPYDAIPEYEKKCSGAEEDNLDCAWLKGLVVAQTVEALEEIEYSGDQRGISEAMEALELEEEPEIQIAGVRILALFPKTPEIESKVGELLFSPYLEVQKMAAQFISRSYDTNPAVGGMGYQWNENHGNLRIISPYEELDIPAKYSQMGFPDYPEAFRFTPADSDRSVGWVIPNSASDVENDLSSKLGVKPIGYQEWYDRQQQAMTKAFAYDPAVTEEMQKLMEQYAKTQDQKILEKVQEMQKKMSEPIEQASAKAEKSVDRVATPPHGIDANTIRYFIVEEKEGRASRLVMMYPHPAFHQTVIQMIWSLNDYEKAWPDRLLQ